MAVEIAIGTFGDAERPVDVEREIVLTLFLIFAFESVKLRAADSALSHRRTIDRQAGQSSAATSFRKASARWLTRRQRRAVAGPAGQRGAATSFRKASARWLMRCFSAGSISPKVRSRPAGT